MIKRELTKEELKAMNISNDDKERYVIKILTIDKVVHKFIDVRHWMVRDKTDTFMVERYDAENRSIFPMRNVIRIDISEVKEKFNADA